MPRPVRHEAETGSYAGGSAQSGSVTFVSANGLSTQLKSDFDGNVTYDRTTTSQTTLNVDGSLTTVVSQISDTSTLASSVLTTVRDDRFSSTRVEDFDGHGVADRTTTTTRTINNNGILVDATTVMRGNGTLWSSETVTTSADQNTVTQTLDRDGNGFSDYSSFAVVGNDCKLTVT